MDNIKVNRITSDTIWELLWKGWDLARVNYTLTLLIVFIFFVSMTFSAIPFLGPIFAAAVSSLSPFVFFKACSYWEKDKPSNLKEVFSIYKNKTLLNKMKPLMIASFVASALPGLLGQFSILYFISTLVMLLMFPVSIIVSFAYPILFFNSDKVDYSRAITLSIEGLRKNIIPFIVGAALIFVLAVLSTLLFVLPLFFVAIPIVITYQYLWYRVVFEDLVLEVKDEPII